MAASTGRASLGTAEEALLPSKGLEGNMGEETAAPMASRDDGADTPFAKKRRI